MCSFKSTSNNSNTNHRLNNSEEHLLSKEPVVRARRPGHRPFPDLPRMSLACGFPPSIPMLSRSFPFRFRIPCRNVAKPWNKDGCRLDESYALPNFDVLNADDPETFSPPPFELRVGWSGEGLAFSLRVWGKTQRPRNVPNQNEESDGLQICLDTRNVKDVHRATRFCHRLIFLPSGDTAGQNRPSVHWFPIHRAKDHPNPIDFRAIRMLSSLTEDGYRLDFFLAAQVLTGYDPQEHPQLGFHYVLVDKEIGTHYFLTAPPMPHDQDPGLWGTLDLVSG